MICAVLSFVPAIVLHEVAHGFAAYKLGDPTAKQLGRLTLNPLAHVDAFGTVILPLCMIALGGPVFGYAKPVPYNPSYFKNPKTGDVVVGLAGPAANLAQAFLAAAIAWLLYSNAAQLVSISEVFAYFYLLFLPLYALVNLYLLFFNLLPIPPLDGSSILALLIPKRHLGTYYQIQRYAMPVLLIVIFVLPYFLHVDPLGIYLDVTAGNLGNLLFPYQIS